MHWESISSTQHMYHWTSSTEYTHHRTHKLFRQTMCVTEHLNSCQNICITEHIHSQNTCTTGIVYSQYGCPIHKSYALFTKHMHHRHCTFTVWVSYSQKVCIILQICITDIVHLQWCPIYKGMHYSPNTCITGIVYSQYGCPIHKMYALFTKHMHHRTCASFTNDTH